MWRNFIPLLIVAFQAVCYAAPQSEVPAMSSLLDGVLLNAPRRAKNGRCSPKRSKMCAKAAALKGLCQNGPEKKRRKCNKACGTCEGIKPTTAGTKPTTAGIKPTTAGWQACLQAHNTKRSLHEAPSLVWDDGLERHAQQWADHLKSIGELKHSTGTDEGENLYWNWGQEYGTCEDAMVGWYDEEEPLYDYTNPGFSGATGHFTQVVWKATKRVGVGIATKKDENGNIETYIVARYSPPGNVLGQFAENVGKNEN